MKATHVGKTVVIDAGKKLVEKAAKKLSTPKSQIANAIGSTRRNYYKSTRSYSQIC